MENDVYTSLARLEAELRAFRNDGVNTLQETELHET